MERISSGQTFFMKRVFPALWIGFVGVATVMSVIVPLATGKGELDNALFLIGPVFMLVLGFTLFRKLVWDLADSVDETRDGLLVRRGGVEQRIAFSDVINVSNSQFTRPPRLTLRLRKPGPWGDEVTFIPKQPAFRFNPFQRNEIAERLIRRVDEARQQGVSRA